MRIAFVSPAFPPNSRAEDYWEYGLCQINQAKALAALGHEVTVIARAPETATAHKDGVTYCQIFDQLPAQLRAWQYSAAVVKTLRKVDPEVVHFHDLRLFAFLWMVRRHLPRATRIFAEYHGGMPARQPQRLLQGAALRSITGLIFANPASAAEWCNKLGLPAELLHYAVECAADRQIEARDQARRRTGFQGCPVLLWNSRAIKRRNAPAVVEAYDQHLRRIMTGEPHFYMMLPDHDPEELSQIKALQEGSVLLQKHLTLIVERKPFHAMTDFYNSADYIISGSEDDPYGFGIVDAMSCGVIPIVTKSATFRDITQDGKVGSFWDLRNPASLVDVFDALATDRAQIAQLSQEVLAHYDARLSMAAQGARLEQIYSGTASPHQGSDEDTAKS